MSIQISIAADSHARLRHYLINAVAKLERISDTIAIFAMFPLFTGGLGAGLAWLLQGKVSTGFFIGLAGGGLYTIWAIIVTVRRVSSATRIATKSAPTLIAMIAIAIAGQAGRENAAKWIGQLDGSPSPHRSAQGFVAAGLNLRGKGIWKLIRSWCCWVLATNLRTWGILLPVAIAALLNVISSQGWGSAFFVLPLVFSLPSGVKHLRERWNVTTKEGPGPLR
ncbi:hypothetical protein OIE66_00840 [Nonomuraea sp. NBC_01738]|uniref:hypothetical protein n=1 Tax=Nonomuraea sp. NBC_01738 TaxID=2976003 RepID=UPI002E10A06C|nr:hypothetical protein OIE66_00840 [Nonomuraea sp. NBC_01738]